MLSVVSNNGTKLYLEIKTCSDFEWLFLANFVAGIYTLIVLQQMQACQVTANLYRCLTSQIHFLSNVLWEYIHKILTPNQAHTTRVLVS